MSTSDKSIDLKLLKSAKKEFLKHGFLDAELKTICDNAGITTGAVYKRYKGKEELFCAVVKDAIDMLSEYVHDRPESDPTSLTDKQLIASWEMNEEGTLELFKMLWEHRESFRLLISRSAGTRYGNFKHDFAEEMCRSTEVSYRELKKRGLAKAEISAAELHVLCSSFWTSVYEPFEHSMKWEEIKLHCKLMCRFFDWSAVIGILERK